jgi:hypothetical protein
MKSQISPLSKILSATSLVLFPLAVHAATPAILENVDGAPAVSVTGADGSPRDVRAGDPLDVGDNLATGPGVAISIAYESGAQVHVSTDSRVQIVDDSLETGDAKTPTIFLKEGDLRAVVDAGGSNYESAPAPTASGSPAAELRPHKFLIRTATAVMGVRGTDFIVSTQGGRPSLNTLSGTVEYADDVKSFQGSGMISVGAGHVLGKDSAKEFEADSFVKEFNKKHPQVETLYLKSKKEQASGVLAQKFMLARAASMRGMAMPTPRAPNGDSGGLVNPGTAPSVITFPGKKKTDPSPKPGRSQ